TSGTTYSFTYDPWTLRRTTMPALGRNNALVYGSLDYSGNFTSGFDGAGRVTRFTLSQNGTNDGTYDLSYDAQTKRLSAVHKTNDPVGTNTIYEYDSTGRVSRQVFPDGTQFAFQRDPLGRIVRVDTA